jgi:hypothetical protein
MEMFSKLSNTIKRHTNAEKWKSEELEEIMKISEANWKMWEEDMALWEKSISSFAMIEARNALIACNTFTIVLCEPDSMSYWVHEPQSIEI